MHSRHNVLICSRAHSNITPSKGVHTVVNPQRISRHLSTHLAISAPCHKLALVRVVGNAEEECVCKQAVAAPAR